MRVQRVLMPGSEAESWTVLGDDQVPVEPVERFLGYLASIEKSPNTAKAYAHDLKDWFTYLSLHGLDWQVVTVEDVAGFVAWLRLPPAGRDGEVAVLPTAGTYCSAASVNRKLAALTSFCEFHARRGVNLAGLLTTMQPAGRRGSSTSYKPFLQHVTKNGPQRRRTIGLKTSRARPKVLTAAQAQAILDACEHLRDRLLFAVLLDCGVRIGEALGLRHEDMGIAERAVTVMPRPNDNRARAKAGISRTIPASADLMRLYADYLTREYGSLDSDYVFVNLWSRPHGRPWTYAAVYDLVQRLRERTGIGFGPHQYRHTYATWLQVNRDVPQEVVRVLLDHDSHRMTSHYAKITDQTVRRRWEQATKVNINGERVTLDPDGPLSQAQWAKTRYGMATQTLPNGYCGLPVQKSCPHANACLTCPVFLSGPEFLPELREQRRRTLTLIEISAGKGQARMAEMNQQVLTNLDRMIAEIAKDEGSEAADAG